MTTLTREFGQQLPLLAKLRGQIRALTIALVVLAVALTAVGAWALSSRLTAPPANAITPEVRAVLENYLTAFNEFDADAFRSTITDTFEFGMTGDEPWDVESVAANLVSAEAVDWHGEVIGEPVMFVDGTEYTVMATIKVTGVGEHFNRNLLSSFLFVDEAGTLKVAGQWIVAYPDD
jgi:hypothetical protein